MDNVIINKASIVDKCIQRIREEYVGHENEIQHNYTKQDSIILNLQRACEASIDLATRVIRLKRLGIPQSSRDVFILLEKKAIIDPDLSRQLQNMVGFRNIAVHAYQEVNLQIVRSIIETNLDDFTKFKKVILQLSM